MRMKKNKRALKLLVGLTGLLGLSSCSAITPNDDGNIITYKGPNGEVIGLKTDDIYTGQLKDAESVKEFYDALYAVAVQNEIAKNPEASAVIDSEVEKTLIDARAKAASDAEKNGTSYEEEFQKELDANNAEDETELKQAYALAKMKTRVEDDFFSTARLAELLSEEDTGYLDLKMPYHIRHILVKTNGANKEFVNDTISKEDVMKLTAVIRELVDGRSTFGDIARRKSDDTGSSGSKYGDSGIVDKDTGFVHEYKLGVYAYDLIYNVARQVDNPQEKLGMDDEILDQMKAVTPTLGRIPYGAVLEIEKYADVTTNDKGGTVNDGQSKYYPRNILFNKYFNRHNMAVITPNDTNAPVTDPSTGAVTAEDLIGTPNASYLELNNYTNARSSWIDLEVPTSDGLSTETIKCLADDKGFPILVTRAGTGSSYEGIHFISVIRNPMDAVDANGTTIDEYYTTLEPTEAGFPLDAEDKPKKTYANYIEANRSVYATRADEIETKIKSYDKMIDYRLYEELFAKQELEITDETIREKVTTYIRETRDNNANNDKIAFDDAWIEYIRILELQNSLRAIPQRLISETCALGFTNDYDDVRFTEPTGACYYVE